MLKGVVVLRAGNSGAAVQKEQDGVSAAVADGTPVDARGAVHERGQCAARGQRHPLPHVRHAPALQQRRSPVRVFPGCTITLPEIAGESLHAPSLLYLLPKKLAFVEGQSFLGPL